MNELVEIESKFINIDSGLDMTKIDFEYEN